MVSLKKKLKERKISIGSWTTIGNCSIAEIMAKSGFDWLAVDMEHSSITLDQATELVRVIELCGITPLVRVGENRPNLIKRVMDTGTHGVIVPMVNTRDDAIRAVSAVKYPPLGKRGVGLARAQGYGFEFERYKAWVKNGSIVIVQIEHIDSIENLEDILKVNGVDGSIIGPYDLSASLGYPGEFQKPKIKEAIARYETVCKKLKKPMGFHIVHPDPQAVLSYQKRGYTFLAVGLDALYLGEKCREILERIKI